ncbi:hypothetical protein [Bordetella flabilis]|uniref:Uncharacterized protein n=1 Tax=Bordetella flabilis TaxID=463014 RepID=A0A193GE59_9BORD|nr:hypothetical protein [Bordetella flabilis]ANN77731.1 hypothetical protein BAU07_11980 [Bordetella flabilis]
MSNAFGIHGALPGVMAARETAARGKIGNLSFAVLAGSPKRRPPGPASAPPRPFNVVETRNNGALRRAQNALERGLGKTATNLRRGLMKAKNGRAPDGQRGFARLDRMAGKAADLAARTDGAAVDIHRILQDHLLQRGTGKTRPDPAEPGARQVEDLLRLKRATGHWMRGASPDESVEQVKRAFDTMVNDESALVATRERVEALCRGLADAERTPGADGSLHIGIDIVKGFRHLQSTRRMFRSAAEDVAFHMPAVRMLSRQPNGADTLGRALCALSAQAGPGWEQAMNRWLDDEPQQLSGDVPRSEVLKRATADLKSELHAFRTAAMRALEEVAQGKVLPLADSSLRDTASALQILYESVAGLPGCKGNPQECNTQIRALYEHALHNALLPAEERNLHGAIELSAPLTGVLATLMAQVDGQMAALRCHDALDGQEVHAMRKRLLYGVLDRMGVRHAIDGLSDSLWLATQRAQQASGPGKRGKTRPPWTENRGKEIRKDRARMAEKARKDMLNRFDALLASLAQGETRPAQKVAERKLPGILDGRRTLARFGRSEDAWIQDIDKRLAGMGEDAIRRMRNGPLARHMAGRIDLLANMPAQSREDAHNVLESVWLRINIGQARILTREYIGKVAAAVDPAHGRSAPGQPGADGFHDIFRQGPAQREEARDQAIFKATTQLNHQLYMTFYGVAADAQDLGAAGARMAWTAMGQGLQHCWPALRDDELAALLKVFSPYAETSGGISLRARQDHIAMAEQDEDRTGMPDGQDASLAGPRNRPSRGNGRLLRGALNELIFQSASKEALSRLARAGYAQAPTLRAGLAPEVEALWDAVDRRLAVQLNNAEAPEVVSRLVRHACRPDKAAVPAFLFTGSRYEAVENRLSRLWRPFEALDQSLSAAGAALNIGLCGDAGGNRIDVVRTMAGLRQAVLEQTGILRDIGDPASQGGLPWRKMQKASRPVPDRGADHTFPFPTLPLTPQPSLRMAGDRAVTVPPPPAGRPVSPPHSLAPGFTRQMYDAVSDDDMYERISLDGGAMQTHREPRQSLYEGGSEASVSAGQRRLPVTGNDWPHGIHHYDTVSDSGSDSGIQDMSSEDSVDEDGYQRARPARAVATAIPGGGAVPSRIAQDRPGSDTADGRGRLADLAFEAAQRRKREALRISMV